ncbi:germination protein GerC [Sporosarcina sp. NCCP-2222]|uniref:Ger(x)C family spore germination protein n=1 Tax=Sporosarcina sp. NCCP-2222 TaxID=2935073 RepID=UPI00208CD18D|nr:Ger(x)C family spore germination protein [Sporosarcina sp. NCCP-2222]GKV56587.1 germination protein GerC [Sporosarcina sp. NCCP-2222]
MRDKWLIILLPSLALLSGCWDKIELEERGYAVVLGLDKSEEDHMVDVTFQIENPQVGSTSQSVAQNEPPSDILTITATDIISAKELANSIVSREIDLSQLQTIIIGEEFARSDYFNNIIGSSVRDPEIRRKMMLIVSKEKASEFIHSNHSKLETRPHKYYSFMRDRWKDTGYVPLSDLNRYFQRTANALFLVIYASTEKEPEIRKSSDNYKAGQVPQEAGDPAQMIGSAVFQNGKMIGTLTGEETRYVLLLRKKSIANHYVDSFKDPIDNDRKISVRLLKEKKTTVKVDVEKANPEVRVHVPITVQVLSSPSLHNYAYTKERQRMLKEEIHEDLHAKIMQLIKKTQEEFGGEPFIWFQLARREFWTMDAYEDYDWQKKYRNADIQVELDITIESFGSQLKPPHVGRGD